MISDLQREMIKEELHWINEYDHEALLHVLAATRGGMISGSSYKFCILGHVAHNDRRLAINLSDKIITELGGERLGVAEVENLVCGVEMQETPATSDELAILEELILKELCRSV